MSPLEEIRHSTAHILATAVLRLYPETKLDIGPPTDSGFYYDFDSEISFTPEILVEIEQELAKVIKENQRFERMEVSRKEAKEIIRKMDRRIQTETPPTFPKSETISFSKRGFMDLCGLTISIRKKLSHKLLTAGSLYRGDASNKQLQRIYGTAFATKDELAKHLE